MHRFARVAEMLAATRRRKAKVALLAGYLGALSDGALPIAARYFAEVPIDERARPRWRVSDKVILDALCAVSGWPASYFKPFYVLCRGWGGAAYEVMHGRGDHSTDTSILDLNSLAERMSAVGDEAAQVQLLAAFLANLSALEMKYALKVLSGQLLVGVGRRTTEAAIAHAYAKEIGEVRSLGARLGDIGAAALAVRASATLALDQN